MNSLEQVRSIFDTSEISIVLIGMPGIEKGSLHQLVLQVSLYLDRFTGSWTYYFRVCLISI